MACGHHDAAFARSGGCLLPRPRPTAGKFFPLALLVGILAAPVLSRADPIKGVVNGAVENGYARIVFNLRDYDEGSVRQSGNVLIITFKAPVDLSVDRLAAQLPGYVGAARQDPDRLSIRLALARKITVNAMIAGEKYFVDLLPDGWKGLPPSLPQDVIEELAQRAREAEKFAQREKMRV